MADLDTRTEWQKRMGIGESQLRDSVVTDLNRTLVVDVPHVDHGRTAGFITHHRDGRVDSRVTPETIRVSLCGKSKEPVLHG